MDEKKKTSGSRKMELTKEEKDAKLREMLGDAERREKQHSFSARKGAQEKQHEEMEVQQAKNPGFIS